MRSTRLHVASVACALLGSVCLARPSRADDETNVPRPPPFAGDASDEPAPIEVSIVPVVGGNSDIGLGGGFVGAIAKHENEDRPYTWRAEVASFTTALLENGSAKVPFSDQYVLLTLPQLAHGKLRLDLRPAFTLQRLLYSGLGNASAAPSKQAPGGLRHYEYERTHPSMLARARVPLPIKNAFAEGGAIVSVNWLSVPGGTVMAQDPLAAKYGLPPGLDSPFVTALIETGVVYDDRNDEIAPTSGQWHEAKARISPGPGGIMPFEYAEIDVTLRGYTTIVPRRLVLAVRGVADLLFGNAPIYELSRFEETNAIGGATGVRGVPAQRYYGKVKVFGNIETRTDVVDFRALKRDLVLGFVTFFDGGRVWLDYKSHPEVDGTGLGLRWGAGGGLRLRIGESLILRGDVAYSPDASPVSGYFQANHMF